MYVNILYLYNYYKHIIKNIYFVQEFRINDYLYI